MYVNRVTGQVYSTSELLLGAGERKKIRLSTTLRRLVRDFSITIVTTVQIQLRNFTSCLKFRFRWSDNLSVISKSPALVYHNPCNSRAHLRHHYKKEVMV